MLLEFDPGVKPLDLDESGGERLNVRSGSMGKGRTLSLPEPGILLPEPSAGD